VNVKGWSLPDALRKVNVEDCSGQCLCSAADFSDDLGTTTTTTIDDGVCGAVQACVQDPYGPCCIPVGESKTLSSDVDCGSGMEVRGSLTVQDGVTVATELLCVYGQGSLRIGTEQRGAVGVKIDLKHDGQLISMGETYVFGEPKTSWSNIATSCNHCSEVVVSNCDGWKRNDKIVVVGMGWHLLNGVDIIQTVANDRYKTDERRIIDIKSGCRLQLDRSIEQEIVVEIRNHVPFGGEVLNMERSVVIGGTNERVQFEGERGIRTRQHMGGKMKLHHTRVKNCGARELGEYCVHFHHVGLCPDCSFKGNAIGWPSINKGLTVHATSEATIEDNVVYRHLGAYLYLEDGSEKNNVIRGNALVCPSGPSCTVTWGDCPHRYNPDIMAQQSGVATCKLHDGTPSQSNSDGLEQSGLYLVSATNYFVNNLAVGHENAMFQDFQAGGTKVWGDDQQSRSVCPQASPFKVVKGNVFHNNNGFGFYAPHSSFPVKVQTDRRGFVSDWNSCLGFHPDTGDDQSAGYTVEDHIEIFNKFGAGGYDGGETSFKNALFAWSDSGNYYKSFQMGRDSGPFCDNCKYIGTLHPNLPGGSCLLQFSNSLIEVPQQLNINHHCGRPGEWTGGLCASYYKFDRTQFTWGFRLRNEAEGNPKYTDAIAYFEGASFFVTDSAHPAFHTHGCETGQAGGQFTKCYTEDIRIVRIYSPDRGRLQVTNLNDGKIASVPYTPWEKRDCVALIANKYDKCTKYKNGGRGYTFLVKASEQYELNVPLHGSDNDFFTLEYSDVHLPQDSITLRVVGSNGVLNGGCSVRSSHSRSWITPYGPYHTETGAWWECMKWKVAYGKIEYRQDQKAHFQANRVVPMPNL
jgi:hypothetical protein